MMIKYILAVSIFCFGIGLDAQVGIGSSTITNPAATLEVKGNPTNTNAIDGIKAPRFTKSELIQKKSATGVYSYNETHKGTFVYVTDITLGAGIIDIAETKGIVEGGLYYFDGKVWVGVSSDLGKISIYASSSPMNASPSANGIGVQNFVNQSAALFLNFGTNDIIYEGVTTLGSASYTMEDGSGNQVSSYFTINEDGFYEISGYVVINPYLGNLSLNNSSEFIAINVFFTTSANTVRFTTNPVSVDDPLTGVRFVVTGPGAGLPDIVYIPPTVVNLKKDDKIYFSAVNPNLIIGSYTGGKQAKNNSLQNKNNISRFYGGEELYPFEKYVSIRKL